MRRMKKNVLALLGLPVMSLLILTLPACNSTKQEHVAVDDAASAALPEIRYYEIADT